MNHVVSLLPLTLSDHIEPVQHVYAAAPSFWEMHGLDGVPDGQAEQDLSEAEETPGRTMVGIVRRRNPDDASAGFEMVGIADFRLDWPQQNLAYLGILLVAEPYQRQGIGGQALSLLEPWWANSAGIRTVRLAVEQYNPTALLFFQGQEFTLTGETSRVQRGDRKIRMLYMEKQLEQSSEPETENQPPRE